MEKIVLLDQRHPEPRPQRRVLVVDDESAVRSLLIELLTAFGYAVSAVSTAAEGLDMLQEVSCDLLITDLLMPGMLGSELVEKVRLSHPALPVIVLTGVTGHPALDALRRHKVSILSKPLPVETLKTAIEAIL